MNFSFKHAAALVLAGSLLFTGGLPARAELSRTGVTVTNGKVSVTQSDTWGGAVVSLKFKGVEFIDVHDAGRELQFSEYCKRGWTAFTTDGYTFKPENRIVINPNQAGDSALQRSHVDYVKRVNDTTLESECIPREWFTREWPGLRARKGAQFDNARFISTVALLPDYLGQVVRLDARFIAPVPGVWDSEIPALYLLPQYTLFQGVDVASNTVTPLTTQGTVATKYTPDSRIGGILASTAAGGNTIGIYGAWEANGGSIGTRFLCYTFGKSCTKLGVSSGAHELAAGQSARYRTYIVTGDSPAQVVGLMHSLYQAGLR